MKETHHTFADDNNVEIVSSCIGYQFLNLRNNKTGFHMSLFPKLTEIS